MDENKKTPPRRPTLVPIAALLMGVALAMLRGAELTHSFETIDRLAKPGDMYIIITRLVCCASVILFAVLARFGRPVKARFGEVYGGAPLSKALYIGGAIALIAAGVYDLSASGGGSMARFVLAALAMLAGLTLVFAMSAKTRKQTAFFSLPSTFFACYWLVLLYRDRTSNPSIELYFYDMLATVAVILAFYYASAYGYEAPKPRRALFCSLLAVALCIMVLGGSLIASSNGVAVVDKGMLGYIAASLVWALGAAFGVSSQAAPSREA